MAESNDMRWRNVADANTELRPVLDEHGFRTSLEQMSLLDRFRDRYADLGLLPGGTNAPVLLRAGDLLGWSSIGVEAS